MASACVMCPPCVRVSCIRAARPATCGYHWTMDEMIDSGPKQMGFDLGDATSPASYEPNRDEVRAELTEILETAKAAVVAAPCDARPVLYHNDRKSVVSG